MVQENEPPRHYNQESKKIKRPHNAWILFLKATRENQTQELQRRNPNLPGHELFKQVSRELGSFWKSLPIDDPVKLYYHKEAAVLKLKHQTMYPDWVFTKRLPQDISRRGPIAPNPTRVPKVSDDGQEVPVVHVPGYLMHLSVVNE